MIKDKIFAEIPIEEDNAHQCSATIQQWMDCYNLVGELDDDMTNIYKSESEGTHAVEGSDISSYRFLKPLKNQESEHWVIKKPKVRQYRILLG